MKIIANQVRCKLYVLFSIRPKFIILNIVTNLYLLIILELNSVSKPTDLTIRPIFVTNIVTQNLE